MLQTETEKQENAGDVVIVGAGPAGLSMVLI